MPSRSSDPVVAARLHRDRYIAMALLVTGDLVKLDPTTGDASCQVRAVIILSLYYQLRRTIDDDEWNHFVASSKDYLLAARASVGSGDDKLGTHPTNGVIRGAPSHSTKKFNALVAYVRKRLGEHFFELLGLSYSVWSGGIVSTDEFWIDFRYRTNNLWSSHEFKLLRARLAKLSCQAIIELADGLPNRDRWVDILHHTKSIIKSEDSDNDKDVEVLCTQVSFNVALAILYHHDIPILDGNIRIQLHNGNGRDQDQDLHLHCDPLHCMEHDIAS